MLNTVQSDLTPTDLLKGDLQLTTPPNIYLTLKKTISDPHKTLHDVADIIEKDPSLSARLLRIVNSAFYGFPAQILSIDRAINLIGYKELQSLVLGTIIIERFTDLPGAISMVDYWSRSLKCALITTEIDKLKGGTYHESAFICGLLHDIGLLVFYRRLPELAREVDLLLQSEESLTLQSEARLEQQIIGFDHYQMGAQLCQSWNLPPLLSETILAHTNEQPNGEISPLAASIREINFFVATGLLPDLTSLEINGEDFSDAIEKSLQEFSEIFSIFYPNQ
jgi:HD-like signal output (HDOD) protein